MDSLAKHGATPVQYLERIGFLGPDVVAAHCIWVDYTDMKILADHQVGRVHNPSSNMMLASGVAPVVDERAAGMRVGLGTDGPAGRNNDLNMMEETDLAAEAAEDGACDPALSEQWAHWKWPQSKERARCTWRRKLVRSKQARRRIWWRSI